ncbi:MAG: GDYXXLXY domain-containing protein [Lentisphaeria bacterium]|jgi:uncharacterized membrane-anchored protein
MRAKWLWLGLAVALQLLVLAWMAGEREWIIRTGRTVWLRTAPIDPRDLFRGDYVRLAYEAGSLPERQQSRKLQLAVAGLRGTRRELPLYVTLREPATPDGVAHAVAAGLERPTAGLFLKGRWRPHGWPNAIQYGIESYFVEQGKGRALERGRPEGIPDDVQVPLEMRVALGRDGTAVLTGHHRWGGMGIGLRIGAIPEAEKATAIVRPLQVTFRNTSAQPQALLLPADLRTLRLVSSPNRWRGGEDEAEIPRAAPATPPPPFTDADVALLAPGEARTVSIPLAEPAWRVVAGRGPEKKIVTLVDDAAAAYQSLRLRYEPPAAAECAAMKERARLWPDRLDSRWFSTWELRPPR